MSKAKKKPKKLARRSGLAVALQMRHGGGVKTMRHRSARRATRHDWCSEEY